MCSSNYDVKRHKSMDQKVFEGCNLAWLQKKGHLWGNWIQMAKHKGTFLLFTFKRQIYKNPLILNKPLVFKHDTPWSWLNFMNILIFLVYEMVEELI